MAIAPHEHPREDGAQRRPVLGGAQVALASLAGCQPERVWALSDDEVRRESFHREGLLTAARYGPERTAQGLTAIYRTVI